MNMKKYIIIGIIIILIVGGYFIYQNISKTSMSEIQPEAQIQPDETNKIYSVDELVESNIQEGTEVFVSGRYNIKLISAGPDYEGPGGGDYLFGETKEIHLISQLTNVESNKIIRVKGKVRYCGGKKVERWICGLNNVQLIKKLNRSKIHTIEELVNSGLPAGTLVNIKMRSTGCIAKNLKVTDDYEGPGSGVYLNGLHISVDSNKQIKEICSSEHENKEIKIRGKIRYCGGNKIPKYICGLFEVELVQVGEEIICAKKGEFVNPVDLKGKTRYPDVCCAGLTGLMSYIINDKGECECLKGTPYLTCMPCGNGICEKSETNRVDENKCNCPEDCQKE